MKKVIATTVFILMSFVSTCFALKFPDDLERWSFFFRSPTTMEYIDNQSYHSFYGNYTDKSGAIHRNHYIIATWKWSTYFEGEEPEKGVAYSLEYDVYDMNCNLVGVRRLIDYDKNGKLINDAHLNFVLDTIPGSVGESEIEALRKFDKYVKSH